MKIAMSLIMDMLKLEYEGNGASWNSMFSKVEMLDLHCSKLDSNILYVGKLSDVLNLYCDRKNVTIICIRDRLSDDLEEEEFMSGIVVIKKNLSLLTLFHQVQDVFFDLMQWRYDLQTGISQSDGLQHMMDVSETILGNFTVLLDATYQMIAWTKHIEIDDPVVNQLLKYGYHTEETLEKLRKFRRYEQFDKEKDIVVSKDSVISNYVTIKKVFSNYSHDWMILVMVCNNSYSSALEERFEIFAEHIGNFLNASQIQRKEFSQIAHLITLLLDGGYPDRKSFLDQASGIVRPNHRYYQVMTLLPVDDQNFPYRRIISDLNPQSDHIYLVRYKSHILVILLGTSITEVNIARKNMEQKIMKHNMSAYVNAGISHIFEELYDFRMAYEQSCHAIQLGEKTSEKSASVPRFYDYEDYEILHFVDHCYENHEIYLTSGKAHRAIMMLDSYDHETGSEYLQILKAFLQNERHATKTSKVLNMHRNTVLYHVNKIEEMIGESLDDPEFRLKLLLEFKYYSLN